MSSPILILGMHRSGTSCLAGCLQAAGLTLGEVNTAAPHNAKGNREHERIRDVHDQLMAYNGYTWDHPPTRQLNWRSIDFKRLERETIPLSEAAAWGAKDPRTVFCVKGWNKRYSPRFVATFRHPDAVADSLLRRAKKWGDSMDRSHALDLWVRYNRELLNITKSTITPFIRFDTDPDAYVRDVQHIANLLGLDGDKAGSFFTESLKHESETREAVPDQCAPVWNQLLERLADRSNHSSAANSQRGGCAA